ncbi:MAG: hypothetical protein H7Y59_13955 [Anaerolineales bacterium]|nr:hypothetical protein [Anaerolineales bacterium]
MNNKNTGLIATIAAVILCGCPGLFAAFWGALTAVISFIPGADINIGGSSDPSAALFSGLGTCCIGILFIAVPVAVGFFGLRKKPEVVVSIEEPLPPIS